MPRAPSGCVARFDDRMTHPLHTPVELLRMLGQRGYQGPRARRAQAHLVPQGDGNVPSIPTTKLGVTWVGHATTILHVGGKRFLTDPVWSQRIVGGLRRLLAPGVAWDVVQEAGVDAVLVSHNHYDHMDGPTLRRLERATPIIVPLGMGAWFRRRRFTDVRELDWWRQTHIDGTPVTVVPSHHWSHRLPLDTNRALWGGFVVGSPPRAIHFAGDTAYGGHFKEIHRRLGPINVTVCPIGAYEPRWFMKSVHMAPEEAVQVAEDLGAKHLASMHWATFLLTPEPLMEPLERLQQAWVDRRRKKAGLWDLGIGETRTT